MRARRSPRSRSRVGYSSHEGAERAEWGDDKLEVVEGTHPVVYPAAGSHANKFTEALYLGSSAEAGVGCDDTRGPHVEFAPAVKTIPSDPDAARRAFPWIAFEGRWGELQRAFFNGPTGPNLKQQWTEPIVWSEGWRARSYAIPTGGVLGTGATDFFCTAVETGSRGLVPLLRNPALTLLVLAALLALVVFGHLRARPGRPSRRCGSRGVAAGVRSSPPRVGCTSSGRGSFSGSASCSSRSASSSPSWRRSCSVASACSESRRPGSRRARSCSSSSRSARLWRCSGSHSSRLQPRALWSRWTRDGTSVRSTPTGSRSRDPAAARRPRARSRRVGGR